MQGNLPLQLPDHNSPELQFAAKAVDPVQCPGDEVVVDSMARKFRTANNEQCMISVGNASYPAQATHPEEIMCTTWAPALRQGAGSDPTLYFCMRPGHEECEFECRANIDPDRPLWP